MQRFQAYSCVLNVYDKAPPYAVMNSKVLLIALPFALFNVDSCCWNSTHESNTKLTSNNKDNLMLYLSASDTCNRSILGSRHKPHVLNDWGASLTELRMTVVPAYLCAVVPTPAPTMVLLPLSTQDFICTSLCLFTDKEHQPKCWKLLGHACCRVCNDSACSSQPRNLLIVKQLLLSGHQRQDFAPRTRPINVAETE